MYVLAVQSKVVKSPRIYGVLYITCRFSFPTPFLLKLVPGLSLPLRLDPCHPCLCGCRFSTPKTPRYLRLSPIIMQRRDLVSLQPGSFLKEGLGRPAERHKGASARSCTRRRKRTPHRRNIPIAKWRALVALWGAAGDGIFSMFCCIAAVLALVPLAF